MKEVSVYKETRCTDNACFGLHVIVITSEKTLPLPPVSVSGICTHVRFNIRENNVILNAIG